MALGKGVTVTQYQTVGWPEEHQVVGALSSVTMGSAVRMSFQRTAVAQKKQLAEQSEKGATRFFQTYSRRLRIRSISKREEGEVPAGTLIVVRLKDVQEFDNEFHAKLDLGPGRSGQEPGAVQI